VKGGGGGEFRGRPTQRHLRRPGKRQTAAKLETQRGRPHDEENDKAQTSKSSKRNGESRGGGECHTSLFREK